ncbi:hypothetical protein HZC34_03150 [Candidatus Saganbacteria bacterium]|nr:hypothetical protein [Candidatus Saganbacteria bacterium]
MKRIFVALTLAMFLMSLGFFTSKVTAAEVGTATISVKDLYSMANRKSYRLGLRAGIISPTDNINVNKDSTFDLGLEFDAKLNENLDVGPRFGIISKKLATSSGSVNDSYTAIKFGFGGRMYLAYWGDYGSTHGFVNAYVAAEGDYYIASKSTAVVAAAPASFAGIGGYGGAGVEFAFGPNTGGYAEVGYQRTSIKATDNSELPLDGYIAAGGARLAF